MWNISRFFRGVNVSWRSCRSGLVALAAPGVESSDGLWRAFMSPAGILCAVLAVALTVAVTMLVRSRRALRRGALDDDSDRLKRIVEASGDIVFEFDAERRTIHCSADLGAQMLNYGPNEICLDVQHPERLVHEADRKAFADCWSELAANHPVELEFRLRKRDGQWCWVQLVAVPMDGKDGTAARAVGVLRNTQELHAAEEALSESRRTETVGTMAGGLAHEFNNHLTPIRGYLELAVDELGGDHEVTEGLRTALERVEYCADLVAQIQAYGRKSLLLPKPEDVSRLLPTMIRLAMSMDRQKAEKVTLIEEIPETLPEILVDKGQLQEALTQLVNNAVEAMPDGGTLTIVAEEVYIHRQTGRRREAKPGAYVCIRVIDSGEGVQPEHQPHIFDPFFTTRGRAKARGMGLSMVQGMVAQHDGWIELHSTPGKGTHVYLFLPVQPAEAAVAGSAPSHFRADDDAMVALPAAPVGRLLVADDESPVRQIVRRVFEKEGWKVEEAADSGQVLDRFARGPQDIDLLILDLAMPGPPVEQVLATILTAREEVKILLISGFDRDDRIEKLSNRPEVDFIGKPFSPKQLLSKVDDVLASVSEGEPAR